MLRLFLHQMNPVVGDIEGNFEKIVQGIDAAKRAGADLCVFPECALVGYPAEDLLFYPAFIDENLDAIQRLAQHAKGIVAVVGFVHREDDLYNAAAVLADGEVKGIAKKTILPNYGVFDEHRYFQSGQEPSLFQLGPIRFGVTICEDLWYPTGPARAQSLAGGAQLIINLSASPYHKGKVARREAMLSTRAADNGVALAFCNMVGGQDELVFDGNSAVFAPGGELIERALPFVEDHVIADIDPSTILHHRLRDPRRRVALRTEAGANDKLHVIDLGELTPKEKPELGKREILLPDETEEVYRALVLGCGDYARKNGFDKVLLGLSGGIDSALTAAIAVDALGADRVVGVTMPSPYSSAGSVDDSVALAANLGIECRTIPIAEPFSALLGSLEESFVGTEPGVAEENLQARIRGTILMALSNKFGWLLFSTGNKSETSVGYCTLYGDMAGGFDVLKDVPKTLVYRLARWRNEVATAPWIPVETIEKEPSAELRPDQIDSDSLPPYEELDPILKALVEDESGLEAMRDQYGAETVERIVGLVDRNEYKRRQTPPGVRITPRAFGKDRRYPITNRYRRPV